jgi:diacylglycerol kinase (ATP)
MDNERMAMVFVNACAGAGRAAEKTAEVRAAFAKRGLSVKFLEPGSKEAFRAEVRRAIAAGQKTLVAMGGDGTVQLLVREAMNGPVNLGVIPLGGGNDFAAALGIRGWEQAVEVIASGKWREVDAVRVRFQNGEEATYLGGGGIGLDAEAARYAGGRFQKWRGRWRYLASAVSALNGYPGVSLEAEFPDSLLPRIRIQALLAAVMNTPSYGGGIRLAPHAQLDDGILEFVMLGMLSWPEVLRLLFWLMLTGELRTARLERRQARAIRILAPPGTLFHGDGEILGAVPLEIEVLSKAVRILAPSSSSTLPLSNPSSLRDLSP